MSSACSRVLVPRSAATRAGTTWPHCWRLIRIIRRERPHIVHTHAAKGGTLGRVATLIAFPLGAGGPVLIHTYHGHSLTGYFSPRDRELYRRIERFLGRVTRSADRGQRRGT